MGSIGMHLRQIVRRLLRAPLFTVMTIVTLAVGIGANAVIFSVLEGVLLKPLPYPHPENLIGLWIIGPGISATDEMQMSGATYVVFREQNHTFEDVGLYINDSVSVLGSAHPESIRAMDVTEATFPLLGISPAIGRSFTSADVALGSPDTVMLNYGYWRDKFGGDPNVVGRKLIVDEKPRDIIGVAPRNATILNEPEPALFLPLKLDRSKFRLGGFQFQGIARLKPGMTMKDASADIARMMPIVNHSFPPPPGFSVKMFDDAHFGPSLHTLMQDTVGDIGNFLWVLMAAIGAVLLIACANVANLLLVRVDGRSQELAIRKALGAGWRVIATDLLLESLLLTTVGTIAGLAITAGALKTLIAMAPTGLPRLQSIAIDARVIFFALGVAVFTAALCAAVPIFKYAGAQRGGDLRTARAAGGNRDRYRARSVLIVVQVALSIVLLICSGLMIRTFRELTHANPGFAGAASVQTFHLTMTKTRPAETEYPQLMRREEAILHEIAKIPGVASAAISVKVPMEGGLTLDNPLYVEGQVYAETQVPTLRRYQFVSPGYFATMGTPLLAGRELTWQDTYNKIPVVIISENLAREIWQDPRQAIGKRIRPAMPDQWSEIIGVVADVRDDGVSAPPPAAVYWPLMMPSYEGRPYVATNVAIVVRSSRDGSQTLVQELSAAVSTVDSTLPLAEVHTLEYFYNKSLARTSFTLVMLGIAGSMALLLGGVGIYGVIAYAVSQRRREIGVRMALGAQQNQVTRIFVRYGVRLTAIGISCGLIAAASMMRLMSALLFQVKPIDPVTFACVSIGVAAIALVASYLPARRAAAIDPVEALRGE